MPIRHLDAMAAASAAGSLRFYETDGKNFKHVNNK
jgi:hypothetical protein